jgi:hypothetical protein
MFDLLGWTDQGHVVVRAAVSGTNGRSVAAYAVDVATGKHELLVHEDRVNWFPFPTYATDLWAHPTVDRPGPDRVLDPRVRAGVATLAALALVGAVLRTRRARA